MSLVFLIGEVSSQSLFKSLGGMGAQQGHITYRLLTSNQSFESIFCRGKILRNKDARASEVKDTLEEGNKIFKQVRFGSQNTLV